MEEPAEQATMEELPALPVFPFLHLPRELRDDIYDHALLSPEEQSQEGCRIERWRIRDFKPTAATILLLLGHGHLLLNRQVASEAVDRLFKKHTVRFNCGPFVLHSILESLEKESTGGGKLLLKALKRIELDWVTCPKHLPVYPLVEPEDVDDEDADHIGRPKSFDYLNKYGDDYDYGDDDGDVHNYVWPPIRAPAALPAATDPFGLSTHYPFMDPCSGQPYSDPYGSNMQTNSADNLEKLISNELTPLFAFLSGPTFSLSSITVPLLFPARTSLERNMATTAWGYPLRIRYWIRVVAHVLLLLCPPPTVPTPMLDEVYIQYKPLNVWSSMDPPDDLYEVLENGIFDDGGNDEKRKIFKDVWFYVQLANPDFKENDLNIRITYVKGEFDKGPQHNGDELEIIFKRENVADKA